jgi:hypothetical protein
MTVFRTYVSFFFKEKKVKGLRDHDTFCVCVCVRACEYEGGGVWASTTFQLLEKLTYIHNNLA